jgi:hypothetical protein
MYGIKITVARIINEVKLDSKHHSKFDILGKHLILTLIFINFNAEICSPNILKIIVHNNKG